MTLGLDSIRGVFIKFIFLYSEGNNGEVTMISSKLSRNLTGVNVLLNGRNLYLFQEATNTSTELIS